jgi:hypothetical protein
MRSWVAAVCILMALSLRASAAGPDPELDRAQLLYESAEYIEALQELDVYERGDRTLEQKQTARWYRALCLIALERTDDAQRTLQDFVKADPTASPGQDVPPRISAMLLGVRQQIAPGLVRDAYARAQASVRSGQQTEALDLLTTVLTLIDDQSLRLSADPAFVSLRADAENLQARASAQVPAVAPPPAPPTTTSSATTGGAATAGSAAATAAAPPPRKAPFVFPPVRPYVPARAVWQPFPPLAPGAYVSGGELAIEVGVNGSVTSARVTVSISPAYDELLVRTALTEWIFMPAMRDGGPVPSSLRIPVSVGVR